MTIDMKALLDKMEQERKEAEEASQTERSKLAIEMQAAGVNKVLISFSGGGDSGAIDEVNIEMADGFSEPEGLKKRLEDFAYSFLEGTGIDWYNNDGGQGSIDFDLTSVPPAFSATVDVNEMVSNNALTIERELA